MNILCIDDDSLMIKIYKKVFSAEIYPEDKLLLADSSAIAIDIIKSQSIDIIFTDLLMAGLSGIDIVKIAKEEKLDTEIVVVTGGSSVNTAVEAMVEGARDYLEKPIQPKLLIEKLHSIRETVLRFKETEELRLAKEVIEESAINTITNLEIELQKYKDGLSDIKDIINIEDEKTIKEQIKNVLNKIEEN